MKKIFIILNLTTLLLFGLDANSIAKLAFNVNHSYYVQDMLIAKKGSDTILSIKRSKGKKAQAIKLERFLKNYHTENIDAKDLIIIRSGKLKGFGVLMTSYTNPHKSHQYIMWIPALRKARRIAEPSKNGGLAAADIAFLEDAKLRRFHDETYELLSHQKRDITLKMMKFKKDELPRHRKKIPYKKKTVLKNLDIYEIKATTKEPEHWYDYRISYIDSKTFTDYKTLYFKDNQHIKTIYRQWSKLQGIEDEKAQMWTYWYMLDEQTGYEMLNYIPPHLIKVNTGKKASFWSDRTLRKLKK